MTEKNAGVQDSGESSHPGQADAEKPPLMEPGFQAPDVQHSELLATGVRGMAEGRR